MTTTLVDNRNDLRKHFCATAMSDICGEASHQILPEHICLFLDSAWKKGGDHEPDAAKGTPGRNTIDKKKISHGRLLQHKIGELPESRTRRSVSVLTDRSVPR